MRRFLFWFFVCFAVQINAAPIQNPTEVIVKFKMGTMSLQSYHSLLGSISATPVYRSLLLPELNIISYKNHSLEEVLATLRSHPGVEYAEPNFTIHIVGDDDDDDDDDDNGEFPWPFPFPPPGDGKLPFPWPPGDGQFPWPPGDGKFPFPWPPTDPTPPTTNDPEPIEPPSAFTPAEDPDMKEVWGIQKTDTPKAWETSKGSKDVIVGIIDTGIDYNHEDLSFNVLRNANEIPNNDIDDDQNGYIDDVIGWDFVHNDKLPYDDHSHGTHVSGTIGAVGNNGIGVSGINQIVSILSIKAFDANGSGDVANAIKAIEYAVSRGAKVLNNSWGDYEFSQALEDVIGEALKKGVTVVCAAGNETNNNDKKPLYPAGSKQENVIAVAASTDSDSLAFFSNYGKTTVHLAAPGATIYSTVPNNKYEVMDGTSMATPHVVGAVALLLSVKPSLTPQEIKKILMDSVTPIAAFKDKVVSKGRLNLAKAVAKVK